MFLVYNVELAEVGNPGLHRDQVRNLLRRVQGRLKGSGARFGLGVPSSKSARPPRSRSSARPGMKRPAGFSPEALSSSPWLSRLAEVKAFSEAMLSKDGAELGGPSVQQDSLLSD